MKYKIGHRFGSLTLQSIDRENYPNNGRATLICDCGRTAHFFMSVLANGHNTNCGCTIFTTVYFIQVNEYVKIGRCKTNGIQQRLALLQTNCPYPATVIRTIEGNRNTEKFLHEHFDYLLHGREWFKFSPEMLTIEPEEIADTGIPYDPIISDEDLL